MRLQERNGRYKPTGPSRLWLLGLLRLGLFGSRRAAILRLKECSYVGRHDDANPGHDKSSGLNWSSKTAKDGRNTEIVVPRPVVLEALRQSDMLGVGRRDTDAENVTAH